MARRKPGHLQALGGLLKKIYPNENGYEHVRVFSWWTSKLPARIFENARPVRVDHGVLTVHVQNSVWANEMHYVAQDLLEQLKREVPGAGIREMRFRIGPLPDLPTRVKEEKKAPQKQSIDNTALPEEIARALSRIADADVRRGVANAASMSLSTKKEN